MTLRPKAPDEWLRGGGRSRRRKTETDVPEAEGVLLVLLLLKIVEAMLEWVLLSD